MFNRKKSTTEGRNTPSFRELIGDGIGYSNAKDYEAKTAIKPQAPKPQPKPKKKGKK